MHIVKKNLVDLRWETFYWCNISKEKQYNVFLSCWAFVLKIFVCRIFIYGTELKSFLSNGKHTAFLLFCYLHTNDKSFKSQTASFSINSMKKFNQWLFWIIRFVILLLWYELFECYRYQIRANEFFEMEMHTWAGLKRDLKRFFPICAGEKSVGNKGLNFLQFNRSNVA